MTEPQTITSDHLRSLLDADADAGSATLGLLEGRIEIVAAGDGALEVISRDELLDRVGEDPGDDELNQQAAILTATVQELGG